MKFTPNEMANGELAVRRMSEKARKVYDETDPISVIEYDYGDEKRYFVDIAEDRRSGLTFEEAEEFLESYDLEYEEEDEEDDI